jgi:class 3 adenylate cyclase
MQYAFSKFDYQIKGMSVAFFLDSENNLREVLRELAQHCSGGQPAIELILEHSRYYQIAIFEFFEGLLRSSLADNERLLHALLPASVVSELKHNQTVAPINVPASTVLFTDFVGFTVASAAHPAEEIVAALEAYFNLFDGIMARHGLEKIKTIGDSYMAAGGVPQPQADHVNRVCLAAIEIIRLGQALTQTRREQNLVAWETRLGIHTGPVQAGIIGQRKFVYDLWGATVNFASRLEQSCEPGRIHVSAEVVAAAHPAFEFISRGPVTMKSVGTLETFYLQPNPVDASFYAQSVDAYFL